MQSKHTKNDTMTRTMTSPILSASTLQGEDVKNASGDTIGKVEDFMLDLRHGRIRYTVLSFGGFLKMGEKFFAIPPEVFRVDRENECLILDVDKDRLENAPGFDKDNWPDTADERWQTEVYEHYGKTPYWR